MTYQDWTIRNKDGVSVIRVEGEDYVEIPGTSENYLTAYADTVANAVVERDVEKNKIKVVLGEKRYILNEFNEIEEARAKPQTVWLSLVQGNVEAVEEEEDQVDGFVTG